MDNLISRQAAIDALCDMPFKYNEDGYALIYRCDATDRINTLPSAQPDIVHCKDCENIVEPYDKGETVWCCFMETTMDSNGFCSEGERREDGISR